MGDHRVSIKIEATFHGVKESTDIWINWVEPYEVPSSVREFFEDLYAKGCAKFEDSLAQYRADEKEKNERKEYERLKEKFSPIDGGKNNDYGNC